MFNSLGKGDDDISPPGKADVSPPCSSGESRPCSFRVDGGTLVIPVGDVEGEELVCTFHKTNRLAYEGGPYPLPPSVGSFPLERVEDHLDRLLPPNWLEYRGIFFPINEREAFWIQFRNVGRYGKAIKFCCGNVNAVSGETWTPELRMKPTQDYLVVGLPDCNQPWLDGHHCGPGFVRQFVATPKGSGKSVEAQVTGEEKFGGIQMLVYLAKEPNDGKKRPKVPKKKTKATKKTKKPQELKPKKSAAVVGDGASSGVVASSGGGGGGSVPVPVAASAAPPAPPLPASSSSSEPAPYVSPPEVARSMYYVGGKAVAVDWGDSPFSGFMAGDSWCIEGDGKVAVESKPKLKQFPKPKQKTTPQEMCLAAGGKMRQDILPDPRGVDFWDQSAKGRSEVLWIHLTDPKGFFEVTGKWEGEEVPEAWDEHHCVVAEAPGGGGGHGSDSDVAVSAVLANVKGLGELDAEDS